MQNNLKISSNEGKIHAGAIGTDIMRKKMGEVLDCVYLRGDDFIIERKSKPMAVLISVEKYNSLTKLAKDLVINMYTQHKDSNISQEEADQLANEAKHAIRKNK